MNIVSRKKEIEILSKICDSTKPEFVVIYGRRRVGKTYLVKEYFNDLFSFYSTGVFSKNKKDQLDSFKNSLIEYGHKNKRNIHDWFEAFERLKELLENKLVYRSTKNSKRIVFLDELPWMDTQKSGFKVALERFWNTYGSRQNDLVLIACGSATSWIIKNILNDRGGFYTRITNKIHLDCFSLKECEEFAKQQKLNLSPQQLVDYYMVFGGVPLYLSLINGNMSIAQNIDNLIFNENGVLHDECKMLFSSLFTNYQIHFSIIEELAAHTDGLTREDILKNKNLNEGGSFSRALEELEQCKFIRSYNNYQNNVYKSIYQLVDPFTLFSLTYLKDKKISSWMNYLNSSGYNSWAGHAFELLCLNHVQTIKFALGIYGVETKEYAFRSKKSTPGAQIDLLIDRKDGVINFCECKYSKEEYAINADDNSKILNQKEVFNLETGNVKNFIVTFITVNGVKNNMYRDVAQKVLTIDDLFMM